MPHSSANSQLDCYTLLADDSSAFASQEDHYKAFKAHVILNVILNDGIVFSDNQALCARNLQALVRNDGLVRSLFENGRFGLALRQGFSDDPNEVVTLSALHDAFQREGKLKTSSGSYGASPELEFMQTHAVVIPWTYKDVRMTFTRTCETLLNSHFGRVLDDKEFALFRDLIEAERLREGDGGLGRAFLQDVLPGQMHAAGVGLDEDSRVAIIRCTDAPYVSNLPRTIGLNPIYSREHSDSFELLRGTSINYQETSAPIEVTMKLDHTHFIEGLNWLDVDDIDYLRGCQERQTYKALSNKISDDAGQLDDVAKAYIELNMRIEDRVIARRPELRQSSSVPERGRMRKMIAVAADYGSTALDVVAFDWSRFGMYEVPAAWAVKALFDVVKSKIEGSSSYGKFHYAASHKLEIDRLKNFIEKTSTADVITMKEAILESSSFSKEIIVT